MKLILQKLDNWYSRILRALLLIMFFIFPCMALTSGSKMPSEYYAIHKEVVKYKREVVSIKNEIKVIEDQIKLRDSINNFKLK